MKPTRDSRATLVDLLDRVLDKGLILDADLMIHVAGIPLLGIKIKAALAGMETMLKYGIWKDWDTAQRAIANEEYRQKKAVPLMCGEEILLKVFASKWFGDGICQNWRSGYLYVTDRRVLLFRKEPPEILFQATYDEIKGVVNRKKNNIADKEKDNIYLWLNSGEVARIQLTNASTVKDTIMMKRKAMGLEVLDELPYQSMDESERCLHTESNAVANYFSAENFSINNGVGYLHSKEELNV